MVKTETGQYQLLRVGPGPVAGTTTVGSQVVSSNIPALQNVTNVAQQQQPQQQQQQQTTQQQMPSNTNQVSALNQNVGASYRLQVPVSTTIQPVPATAAAPVGGNVVVTAASTPTPSAPPATNPASNSGQVKNVKENLQPKRLVSRIFFVLFSYSSSDDPRYSQSQVQKLFINSASFGERTAGIGGHKCPNAHSGFGRCQGRTGGVYHEAPARTQLFSTALSHSISQGIMGLLLLCPLILSIILCF